MSNSWFALVVLAGFVIPRSSSRYTFADKDLEAAITTHKGSLVALRPLPHSQRWTNFTSILDITFRDDECTSCAGLAGNYMEALKSSERPWLTLSALSLLIGFLIWCLIDTAQVFFTPPLLYWTHRLRLRPEVAGATLLAMGNGAPDIADAVAAGGAQDMPLAISELLGANMVALGLNGAACILAFRHFSGAGLWRTATLKTSRTDTKPSVGAFNRCRFLESLGFYSLGIIALAFILFDAKVTLYEAFVLPSIFFCYLGFIIFKKDTSAEAPDPPGATVAASDGFEEGALEGLSLPEIRDFLTMCVWITLWPVYAIRWITVPPSDGRWDNRRRVLSALCPVGLSIFFAVSGLLPFPSQQVVCPQFLGAAALLGVTIFVTAGSGPDLPWFYPALTLVAKVSSIVWLTVISNEITAIIESIGRYVGTSRMLLGVTLVAWSNTIGDCVTCMALASVGRSHIAFTGLLAGPIFEDLIGPSLTFAYAMVKQGQMEIEVFNGGWPSLVETTAVRGLCCLIIAVAILAAMGLVDHACPSASWALALVVVYSVFVLSIFFA